MNDLMIDIETMSTEPNAAIVSIGAVFFDMDKLEIGNTFYRSVNLATAVKRGAVMDAGTVMWWLGQSEEARKAIRFNGVHVDEALQAFSDFVSAAGNNVRPWGNSASFDVTIMETAMKRSGVKVPWHYSSQRCYRTIKAMFGSIKADETEGVHHNALDDAIYQVKHLFKIKGQRRA